MVLPVDTVAGKDFDNETESQVFEGKIEPGYQGLDIGPKTVDLFTDELQDAKTVVWNGPLGVFEMANFAKGTEQICEVLAQIPATTIIGGGDSATAASDLGFADDFDHISTGGGASLQYLEGKELPGIAAISDK